ncbi:unnamed protein product [Nezara viridula]|uniref:Uncharacterized protein n=1 Tax=Nezara viridula TaxID=85310 RepID=A0A9P0E9Y1_NEZVI|nr:unnamed protein product [Nezara viridula]
MCLLRLFLIPVLIRLMVLRLSISIVALISLFVSSSINFLMYRSSLKHSAALMNSASVLLKATISCLLDLQETGPPL